MKPTPTPKLPPLPFSRGDSLLEPHYDEPYKAWKAAPGPDANYAMLQAIDPVIRGAVNQHVGQTSPSVHSQARLLALQAMQSYDPKQGKLQSHIYNHLQGLKRINAQQLQGVKAPERIVLDSQHVDREIEEMKHELGREPSDMELADRTGFSPKRLAKLRRYRPGVAEGTMEASGTAGIGNVRLPGAGDADLIREIVYEDLDPYHQKIMELAMGLNGRDALPNHVIAAKMGRSPGAISQAKARIQQLLDQTEDVSPFRG